MQQIPKKTKVLIIGGGPAGAFAGARLAQAGIDVVLLEKEKFPRYTVGESIIPHVWKYTDMIGVSERIEAANFIKKGGGAAFWEGTLRAVYFGEHGYVRPGMHVERETFDDILLTRSKELGVQVFEQVKVTQVVFKEAGNDILYQHTGSKDTGRIEANYLIDASGQSAIIGKQEKIRTWDADFKFQAFWGYFDKSDYLDKQGHITNFQHRFETPPMSLASTTGNWGWVWHLILQNKVSVGALIPKIDIAKFKAGGSNLSEKFLAHIRQTPLTSLLLKDSQLVSKIRTTRDYAYQPRQLTFNHCFLTGDAASFADPINSEGVTMALYGGFLAAYAVEQSLAKPHRSAFYAALYETTLQKRYHLFKVLSYPSKQIPKHLIKSVKEVLLNQSREENYLIAKHLLVTNRAADFPELMTALGSPLEDIYTEIEWTHPFSI